MGVWGFAPDQNFYIFYTSTRLNSYLRFTDRLRALAEPRCAGAGHLVQYAAAVKTVIYFYESAFHMWRRRLAGIYAVARREGWHVEAVDVGESDAGAKAVIGYWEPVGAIVEGGVFRHRGCSPAAFSGVINVFCDVDESKMSGPYFGVRHNSGEVVKKAVRELLAQDFADYAYVNYRTRREWTMEREALFAGEMSSHGKRTHVFRPWDRPKVRSGPEFARCLGDFIAGLPKPCGILAANDETAAYVLNAARMVGVPVPEEMTVMGIDNDVLTCENTSPTLSSVAPAFEHSGRLAAGLLARRIRLPGLKPVVVDFGSDSIVRRLSTSRGGRKDIRLARAVEYIRVNACKGISVSDAVREMGLSMRTAENRFRAVVGHSIRDEIVSVRIAKAKELLANAKIAVNSVYAYCGYKDERSLRYAFTKATGMSPSAWRQRHVRRKGHISHEMH